MSTTIAQNFTYELLATDGQARAGCLHTPHGVVETPVFMPVGTHSTVRGMTWEQIEQLGAQIVLTNAYHMFIKPGHQLVERAGGLHGWGGWHKPILTDSGGYQVFSLAKHRKITPQGVAFKDPLTGQARFIGPKESMAIQNALGADIIMAFDECPPYPATHEYVKASLEVTNRWLGECFEHHARPHDQALFPIVQGACYEDLREASVEAVRQFNAHGYAIGGVSVGEPKAQIQKIVKFTAPLLPAEKPRYLMGVGTPEDLLTSIRAGVDMFDCVMPTRLARHGGFFTPTGRRIIKNAAFSESFAPIVEGCPCYTCTHHHGAYLHHLFKRREQTAGTLLSIHNLHMLLQTARDAREAILANRYEDFYHARMEQLGAAAVV